MVVIDAVFEGGVLTHGLGAGERGHGNHVKVTKVPTESARRHDDHPLPGATTQLADGGVLWTDSQLSFLTHLVETRLVGERSREIESCA